MHKKQKHVFPWGESVKSHFTANWHFWVMANFRCHVHARKVDCWKFTCFIKILPVFRGPVPSSKFCQSFGARCFHQNFVSLSGPGAFAKNSQRANQRKVKLKKFENHCIWTWTTFFVLKSHFFLESKNHRVRCAPLVRHGRVASTQAHEGRNQWFQQRPRITDHGQAHEGRNWWFQQRPRIKDHGAAC